VSKRMARRVMRVMNCERVQAGDGEPSVVDWVAKLCRLDFPLCLGMTETR
jgi:hypothetical protein